jgi:hypothetical protein
VQVHYGEGVAIRIGPEPCVGTREGNVRFSVLAYAIGLCKWSAWRAAAVKGWPKDTAGGSALTSLTPDRAKSAIRLHGFMTR